ncbi:hypothetical protein KIL84_014518 [Mauremys mutica]|uniref:Uncharacterized protein n=1 Tax=Mauremys mutica TaxID=74926 RepID=A0A9D3XQC5_9SAUR|nr:hypothetical protein KIL84_014518 [Mauremys mutica]
MCDLPIFPLKCLLLISQTNPILPMNSTTAVVTIRETARIRELKALAGAQEFCMALSTLYVSSYCPGSQKLKLRHTKKVTKKKEISSEDYHAAPFNLSPTHLGRKQNQFLETSKTTHKKTPQQNKTQLYFLITGPMK